MGDPNICGRYEFVVIWLCIVPGVLGGCICGGDPEGVVRRGERREERGERGER